MTKGTIFKYIKKYSVYAPFLLLLVVLIISLCRVGINGYGERKVYYFYSADTDCTATEVRYMRDNPVQGKVKYFVDDLLLGPMTNRYKYLFAQGTTVEFCMQEGKTLYVGLSADALSVDSEAVELREGVDLLRFNIVKNFTKINTVKVYIDGKSVWDEA